MGRKIPYDIAVGLGRIEHERQSLFAAPEAYPYKINIDHPKIRPLYEDYKKRLGERILSDGQRLTFEAGIMRMIQNGVLREEP